MARWGIVIGLAGLALIITAIFLPSTVSNETMIDLPYSGGSIGSGRYTETYNLVRAQLREMVLHGGLALMLMGVVLFVGGRIEAVLRRDGSAAIGAGAPALSEPVEGAPAAAPARNNFPFDLAIGVTAILIGIVGLAIAYGGKSAGGQSSIPRNDASVEAAVDNAVRAAEQAAAGSGDLDNVARNAVMGSAATPDDVSSPALRQARRDLDEAVAIGEEFGRKSKAAIDRAEVEMDQ